MPTRTDFRSIAQLTDQLVGWSRELPLDVDIVVGLPDRGLLPATILASVRNLPMTDLDGFLVGRTIATGRRPAGSSGTSPESGCLQGPDGDPFLLRPRTALVLADLARSGDDLRAARQRIEAADLPHRIRYAAVYVTEDAAAVVDHRCELVGEPICFEWDILHHPLLRRACVDLDGVLCVDPRPGDDDDGDRYREFIRTATPLHVPTTCIGHIVTNRLEVYRPETEQWLAAQGIRYRELVMLDLPDRATRRALGVHAAHKAQVYRETGAELFIESELRQSVAIASLSGRSVLCVDTMQMIHPGALPVARPALGAADPTRSSPRAVARRIVPPRARRRLRALAARATGAD